MKGISPWVAAVNELFNDQDLPVIFKREVAEYTIKVHSIYNALWIAVTCPKGGQVILRAANAPNDDLQVTKLTRNNDGVLISLSASMGDFKVRLQFPGKERPVFRYTTTLKTREPLLIPFWPRDMVLTGENGDVEKLDGKVHVTQKGTRSGLQFISMDKPKSGVLLYMQNLTALNDYFEATLASAENVVGGTWPELGFALPPAKEPLPAGREVIISDAFLAFDPENAKDELALAATFLNLLAAIYLHLPKPDTVYHNWPDIVEKGLHDLQNDHGCWCHAAGNDYLNAYVSDYKTPPESMVQLAVLLPLFDYHTWSKKDMPAVARIKKGIGAFYDEKIGTVVRWLPSSAEDLDGSEEQLKPNVMDSWYLHHPLLNLGRMALRGDKEAKKLFLDSLAFTVKVARHFKYNWPVFYDMETLDVIKGETKPGMGGEKDVAGLYAYVMMHAWELTKEKKYLEEAKKAAKTLSGKGFELFYQANNTAFSADAMLWLYRVTKNRLYLNLSYLCLAAIVKNMHIWECRYGYAKAYTTFFGVFPLNDAAYTAAYEEQEVFSAMHNYLMYSEGLDILPSVSLLLAEFIRYIVQRAAFYYPPNLPKEMLSDEVKMGEVDPKLWIALEDIHDGWEKSGQVGQEVYGAGVAFGIVPRHYYKVPAESFMVYIDYPISGFRCKARKAIFSVKGDEQLSCRMVIVKMEDKALPKFEVSLETAGKTQPVTSKLRRDGHLEFIIPGNSQVAVNW